MGDIILFPNQLNIVLLYQHGGQRIDIVREGTDYAHSCDIVQCPFYIFYGKRHSLSAHLINDTYGLLQPRLDGFKGIPVIGHGEFLIQHPELGLHLHHGAAVSAHQFQEGKRRLQQFLRALPFHNPGKGIRGQILFL